MPSDQAVRRRALKYNHAFPSPSERYQRYRCSYLFPNLLQSAATLRQPRFYCNFVHKFWQNRYYPSPPPPPKRSRNQRAGILLKCLIEHKEVLEIGKSLKISQKAGL